MVNESDPTQCLFWSTTTSIHFCLPVVTHVFEGQKELQQKSVSHSTLNNASSCPFSEDVYKPLRILI